MAENEKFNEIVDELKEKAGNVKEEVREAYEKASAKAQEKVEEIKNEIDDYTAEQDAEDVEKNKLMAVLAYISILVLIPLFCAKESKFARFHTNQGLVLCIIGLIIGCLTKIPVLGFLFKILNLVVFAFAIVGIIYAVQGKAKELPVVGNWKILK